MLEAQLSAAEAQLDLLHVQAAQAVEAYDAAVARLSVARTADQAAAATATRAAAAAAAARDELGRWASAAYRSGGPMTSWSVVLSAHGAAGLIRRGAALRFVGEARAGVLARAIAAEAVAEQARATATQALAAVGASTRALEAARAAVLLRLSTQQAQVDDLLARRAALLEQLAATRRTTTEAEAARLAALRENASKASTSWGDPRSLPLTRSSAAMAADAVAFALAQLGKPYLWGGDGPDAFDCSGLTMRAWERGGILLPHYSAAQAQLLARVPLDSLRAGDLVFFATDPLDATTVYHVGMYVGDGRMVEAPHPGATVRLSSIWQPHLLGAGRP